MGKPVRDALVYRIVSADGSVWDIRRIALPRLAAHVEAGWVVLITSDEMRDVDISRTYRSDIDRPFNPPR